MRYGVPYKGSKNQIAPWVLSVLSSAENFYDVFDKLKATHNIAIIDANIGLDRVTKEILNYV